MSTGIDLPAADSDHITIVPTPFYDQLVAELGEPGQPNDRLSAAFDQARSLVRTVE